MYFKNFAYAKLNLSLADVRSQFIDEFDQRIAPLGITICNRCIGNNLTRDLNKKWNMVDDNDYNNIDCWQQPGNINTYKTIFKEIRAWKMTSLLALDAKGVTDPLLLHLGRYAGPSLRNEAFDLNFFVKDEFKDLAIVKWINDNLPFEKIIWMHCVYLDPGSFSTIHRDQKGLRDSDSSAGINKVFSKGFITLNINITSGEVPLYWSLDGKAAADVIKTDDDVYITNDYFLHGVPRVKTRRRQIRISGIPKPEMIDLLDKNNMVVVPDDYEWDQQFPKLGIHFD